MWLASNFFRFILIRISEIAVGLNHTILLTKTHSSLLVTGDNTFFQLGVDLKALEEEIEQKMKEPVFDENFNSKQPKPSANVSNLDMSRPSTVSEVKTEKNAIEKNFEKNLEFFEKSKKEFDNFQSSFQNTNEEKVKLEISHRSKKSTMSKKSLRSKQSLFSQVELHSICNPKKLIHKISSRKYKCHKK